MACVDQDIATTVYSDSVSLFPIQRPCSGMVALQRCINFAHQFKPSRQNCHKKFILQCQKWNSLSDPQTSYCSLLTRDQTTYFCINDL